jgi:hypothetical protein
MHTDRVGQADQTSLRCLWRRTEFLDGDYVGFKITDYRHHPRIPFLLGRIVRAVHVEHVVAGEPYAARGLFAHER